VSTQRDSPVHRDALLIDVLRAVPVKDLMTTGRPFVTFAPQTTAVEMLRHMGESTWQDVFPVVDAAGTMVGIVGVDAMRVLSAERADTLLAIAADMMQPPVFVRDDEDLRHATQLLVANGLRELPVVDGNNAVVGFLDEREVARLYLKAEARAGDSSMSLAKDVSSIGLQ